MAWYLFVWNDSRENKAFEGWQVSSDHVDYPNGFDSKERAMRQKRQADMSMPSLLYTVVELEPIVYGAGEQSTPYKLDTTHPLHTEIHFDMGDQTWAIPTAFVTQNRAHYYGLADARQEKPEDFQATYDSTYDREYRYTLKDAEEAVDWLRNNMNWKDIQYTARLVEDRRDRISMQERWLDAENFEVK